MAITILDEQLKIGQVKSIMSDSGRHIDYMELLFSPTTKAQFQPNDKKTGIVFSISDNNFDLPEMVCELESDTLWSLIVALKNMYNQLDLDETPKENEKPVEKPTKPTTGGCCRRKIF